MHVAPVSYSGRPSTLPLRCFIPMHSRSPALLTESDYTLSPSLSLSRGGLSLTLAHDAPVAAAHARGLQLGLRS